MLIWVPLAGGLAITLILVGLLLHQLLIVVVVKGTSMSPSLEHGDRVLAIRHWPVRWLHKGDVVLLRSWLTSSSETSLQEIKLYMKRIVGLGGEVFTAPYDDASPIGDLNHPTTGSQQFQHTWYIPPRSIFVCGDNGPDSIDSRHWGPLPIESILGIVVMKLPRRAASSPLSGALHQPSSYYLGLTAGQDAPPFVAQTLHGEPVTLATYSGRAVVFVFFAPANHCRNDLLRCMTLAPKVTAADITLILVSCTGIQPTWTFVDELNIQLPVLVAPRASNRFLQDYYISTTPAYCFVNEQGIVRSAGPLNWRWGAWKVLAESWVGHVISDLKDDF